MNPIAKYRDPSHPDRWFLTDFTMEQIEGNLVNLTQSNVIMRDWISKFGRHIPKCKANKEPPDVEQCNCGMIDALILGPKGWVSPERVLELETKVAELHSKLAEIRIVIERKM